jgi:anaerobic magnesium-protoporphyrin IX monomethyl ester cyclase
MSKILLIKPRFLSGFEFQIIAHPVGLMYIGATLKRAGHESKIHDCALDYKDLHILRHTIKEWKPDFIGISIIITELDKTRKIMEIIREILPDVAVTFGGSWPSTNQEEAIRKFGADFIVIGEGELAFPELIDAINNGRPTESIPGTASLFDNHVNINKVRYLTEDELNSLPFPAWELLDHKLYAKNPSFATVGCRPYMTIVTSRGCPFKCAYCHQTMGKVFRKRSAESVISEMEELWFKYGFKEFEIADDCFNLDPKRMYEILIGIRDRFPDVKLHFPNGLRADMLKPEDMALFKQAGTVSAHFAIETSNPRLQKMIHKNLNIEKANNVINAAVKAGIYSSGFFMIGFPTETYKEASSTLEFAVHSSLHRAFFFNPIPFPGTKLAEMVSDIHKKINYDISPYDASYFTRTFNISAMSDNDLKRAFRRANIRFYLNPKRILRLIIHHPRILSLPLYGYLFLIRILPTRRSVARVKYSHNISI